MNPSDIRHILYALEYNIVFITLQKQKGQPFTSFKIEQIKDSILEESLDLLNNQPKGILGNGRESTIMRNITIDSGNFRVLWKNQLNDYFMKSLEALDSWINNESKPRIQSTPYIVYLSRLLEYNSSLTYKVIQKHLENVIVSRINQLVYSNPIKNESITYQASHWNSYKYLDPIIDSMEDHPFEAGSAKKKNK
jgi:hypothetical protein